MKTPREILSERHQAAEPKLEAIRRAVVEKLNNKGTKELSHPVFFVTLFLRCSKTIWLELVLPSRRIWAGMAAVWLGIVVVNVSMRDNSPAVAMKSSQPGMMMTFQQQERLLAELTEPRESRAAEPPKKSVPQPRSERRDETATA